MAFQERYQPDTSPLHRLDPRVKVVCVFLMIIGISLTPERALPAYPLLWALLASLAEIGHLGALRVGRTAVLALPFALAALTVTFTTPGHPVTTFAGFTLTDAGLMRFVAIALKSWLASQAALMLAMTTEFADLLWALSSLRMPTTLVMMLAFTYRYLFTLQDEAVRLIRARAARSGVARSGAVDAHSSGGSLMWRARVAGGMIGNLLLRSYERSERVYIAMQARGYHGQMRLLNPPKLTRRGVLQGALPVVILVFIEILAVVVWSR